MKIDGGPAGAARGWKGGPFCLEVFGGGEVWGYSDDADVSEGGCRLHQCQKLSGIFYMIVELLRPFPSPNIIVRNAGLEPVFEELLKIYNFHLHQRGLACRIGNTISQGGGAHPQVGSYKGGSSKNLCEFCRSYLIASIASQKVRFWGARHAWYNNTLLQTWADSSPRYRAGILLEESCRPMYRRNWTEKQLCIGGCYACC